MDLSPGRAAGAKHQNLRARGGFPFVGADPAALIYSTAGWLVPPEKGLLLQCLGCSIRSLWRSSFFPHCTPCCALGVPVSDDALQCKWPHAAPTGCLSVAEEVLGISNKGIWGHFIPKICYLEEAPPGPAEQQTAQDPKEGHWGFSSSLPIFIPQKT